MCSPDSRHPTFDSPVIKLIHRLLDAILDPAFDGFTHGIEQALDGLLLFRVELIQHEIGEIIQPRRRWSDPDSEPGIVLPLKRALDALEAVVSPGGAGTSEPKPPHGQRHVVYQNQEMLTGIEPGKAAERPNCGAAPVHVGLRLEYGDRGALPLASRLPGPVGPAKLPQLPARRQPIGEDEPGVVTRALVLRARIAEPHDRVQGSGFRFGLRLGFGLGLPNELGLGRGRGFLHRRGCLFSPRSHDGTHGRIRIVQNFRLFDPHVANEQ
jgi:hypothetical protein